MNLTELVLRVHAVLDEGGVSHAFGGALALTLYSDPRTTIDVDVNVFVPVEDAGRIADMLATLSLAPEPPDGDWVPSAGMRLRGTSSTEVVDLFPSIDEVLYRNVEERVVFAPFGPDLQPLPFLSVEDLVVFKLSFGREKDWTDLRAIAGASTDVDIDYVEKQLVALRGPKMHPRLARFRSLRHPPAVP